MLKELFKFLLNPNFLKISLLIIMSLMVIYNALLLLNWLKQIKKPELDANFSLLYRVKYFLRIFLYLLVNVKLYINIGLFLGFAGLVAGIVVPQPKVVFPSEPALGVTEVTKDKPLVINFDRPIRKENLKYSISPELGGNWNFKTNLYSGSSALSFIPIETPEMETRYTVSLTEIRNIVGVKKENYLFGFLTSPIPKVTAVEPANGVQGVLPKQEIVILTDVSHNELAQFSFELSPPAELEVAEDGLKYILKPKSNLSKGTDYTLTVLRTLTVYNYNTKKTRVLSEKQEVGKSSFRTIDAPGVSSYSPTGSGVLANSNIQVEFKQDMNKEATEKAFSLTPKADGGFSWEGNRLLKFLPKNPLEKNTQYTVSISKEAKAADESLFESGLSYSFTTIGYVTVSGFYPANSARNVDIGTKISITFNQAVDHKSAEDSFALTPKVDGSFSWNGNTMVFSHGGFLYSQNYAVSIGSGVKAVYGLDSIQAFSAIFTTKEQSIVLNIPSYRQSHLYTCMAAAARDALSYRGLSVGELEFVGLMGYDPTTWSGTWRDANATWGDPNAAFVGDIDGNTAPGWGYGSHWDPVAKALSKYRTVEVKQSWTVQGIAQEIANGNPIIIWWVNGVWPAYEVTWQNNGRAIRAVNSMHVQVVKGFTGTVQNPTSFVVNDSGYGYPSKTFDVNTFAAKWSWFGNTGIVVR